MVEDCCAVDHSLEKGKPSVCPHCGQKGKSVPLITLKHQLKPPLNLEERAGRFFFDTNPVCPVVYFSSDGSHIFTRGDVRYRVGSKEKDPPHDICYCFGYTKEIIEEDLRKNGKTDIPKLISAEVKAGNCACEFKNPQGSCCLGNVQRAIRDIHARGWAES